MVESVGIPELIAIMGLVLVGLGIIGLLWDLVTMGIISMVTRGLVELGLINPDVGGRDKTAQRAESGFLLFSKALRAAARPLPGADPKAQPWLMFIPLLFVGVPLVFGAVVLFVVVPFVVFGRVLLAAPGFWSFPLALASFFGYYAMLAVLRKASRQLPKMQHSNVFA